MSVDPERNQQAVGGRQGDISAPDSRVRVLVIPTDEELSIAQQTLQVVSSGGSAAGAGAGTGVGARAA